MFEKENKLYYNLRVRLVKGEKVMKYNKEFLEGKCEVLFHVEVEAEEWKEAQNKAAHALVQNVTVKGFRKGKAPFETAVKYVKPQDILERAADKMVQKAYADLLKDEEVKPFVQPEIQVKDFTGEKLVFYFDVVTSPVVTLGQYKDLTIEKKAVKVTKKDVENELVSMANQHAELVVAEDDSAAVLGDTVVIDFKGFVDGEAFDGGEASSYELSLGSNTFIPGFEDQLVGVKTGEDRDIAVKFPENYVANLSSKEATFKVHVNAIKHKVVPAIDEEFVKDLDINGVETLEQLHDHVKAQLAERKTNEALRDQESRLIETVVNNASFKCHDKVLAEDVKRILDDLKSRLDQQGFELNDYYQMTGKNEAEVRNEALEQARNNAKHAFVYDAIAREAEIKVTNEDVEARLQDIANRYNMKLEDVKKHLEKQLNSIAYNIKDEKVVEFLKKNNNL